MLFGGLIAAYVNWRVAFIVVGLAGVALAPIFKWVVKDPPRGGMDRAPGEAAPAEPPKAPAFKAVLATIMPKPSFWLLSFGAACSSICGYGVAFWLPTFFQRSFGLTLPERAMFYSALSLIGGVAGIWLGGVLADKFGSKNKAAYALAPAICFLVALPCFLLAMNVDSMVLAFLLFLIPTGLNLAWLGPVIAAVQHLAPASMRTTTSALFLLINNLLGLAVGLWFFGYVSDLLAPRYGAESMRYALYFGLGFYVASAVLLIFASRRLKRDWVD